jgi:hypothetical protein
MLSVLRELAESIGMVREPYCWRDDHCDSPTTIMFSSIANEEKKLQRYLSSGNRPWRIAVAEMALNDR